MSFEQVKETDMVTTRKSNKERLHRVGKEVYKGERRVVNVSVYEDLRQFVNDFQMRYGYSTQVEATEGIIQLAKMMMDIYDKLPKQICKNTANNYI